MPRADPWCDGGLRFWEENEFYRTNEAPKQRPTESNSWIGPAVGALATTLFILGPEGIVLSAAVGLAFAALQPPRTKQYTESIQQVVNKAVTNGLRGHETTQAADDISDFQSQLPNAQLFASNLSEDDYNSLETTVLKSLFDTVQAGGTLQRAFDTFHDNLFFDGYDHGSHTQWSTAAVLSIFQAYWVRCTAYAQMAQYYRSINNFHKYNEKLNSLRIAYEGLHSHIPRLLSQIERRIVYAKTLRSDSVTESYDRFDPGWMDRNFGSGDTDSAIRTAYVWDKTTDRKLEVGALWPGTNYSDGMGIKATDNNKDLEDMAKRNKGDYVTHLQSTLTKDAALLVDSLKNLHNQFDGFVSSCKPASPQFPPLHVGFVDMGVKGTVPEGTHQSFRIILVDKDGKPITEKPSPWSRWIKTGSQTKLHQFLIGDGYAMTDTYRQIWMRVRSPKQPLFELEQEKGVLVDTIRGHGLLLWPEHSQEGSI